MKKILVIGAGKSATCLIDHLVAITAQKGWTLSVADADESLARSKVKGAQHCHAIQLDISDEHKRKECINPSDIVISLLPPHLHILAARTCIELGKNLLTASYLDEGIKSLEKEINKKNILFLYEMGLDPGIDHMSALELIHRIKEKGGSITSFYSHCGGLVAPESDDNPWHYKISWNPRNIVQAGKSGALYLLEGKKVQESYESLFNPNRTIQVPGLPPLAWYPNRDSLGYLSLYNLEDAHTFVRTTLRYPAFCQGWSNLIRWKLTDESPAYDTTGLSLKAFFQQHFNKYGIELSLETAADSTGLIQQQLLHLGLEDDTTLINKGLCSALDVLQFCLEKKLALGAHDKDMIVMVHELEYTLGEKKHKKVSSLVVKGKDPLRTAMAQTVGLPLAIAAILILEGKVTLKGLKIPTDPELYIPVLKELALQGISFTEGQD
jgi:saccharopine dehydrogenase (NADP+, L-glutamate forming)